MRKVGNPSCTKGLSLMLTCKNIVVKTNDEFLQLTGYDSTFFIGKQIDEVFDLLKINKFALQDMTEKNQNLFIFARSMIVKEIQLKVKENTFTESKIYFIIEKNDLNIEYNFNNIAKMYEDTNTGVAAFSLPDLILLEANQQYLNFLYPPYNNRQCAYGETLDKLCFSGKLEMVKEAIKKSVSTLNPAHIREILLEKSDQEFYFDLDVTPMLVHGNAEYIIIKAANVTERVHDKASSVDRAHVLNLFALPVVRVSYPDLRIVEVNETATKCISDLTGNPDLIIKNLCDKTAFDLLPSQTLARYWKSIEEMLQTKQCVHLNKFEICQGNKKLYYNLIFQPVFDIDQNINEFILTLIDVTEETEQEYALKKAMRMKDEFLSFVSHEFKTPLTVIYSAVQAIEYLHKNELSTKSLKFINKIHQNTLRQLRLVNNLLDITRSEAGYLKLHKRNADIVGMSKAIADSVAIYAEDKDIEIVFRSTYDNRIIAIDDEKYERILLNLLSNAIKFTPEGKKIYLNIYPQGSNVCIEVKDEGVGIPNEKLNIIFDRFGQVDSSLTRNSEGTGIGLYLVKMLTLALGGNIEVDSVEGQGSSFRVLLEDKLEYEETEETMLASPCDSRLIQTIAIEFSDIYSLS